MEKLVNIFVNRDHKLSEFEVSIRAAVSIRTTLRDEMGTRVPLTGDIEFIRSDLYQYQEGDPNYLVISIAVDSTGEVIKSTIKFGDAILN